MDTNKVKTKIQSLADKTGFELQHFEVGKDETGGFVINIMLKHPGAKSFLQNFFKNIIDNESE